MLGATAGLRILDLTEGLAGPLATMILADFGADVIGFEDPSDDHRDGQEPAYLLLNRGKKSAGFNLRSPAGEAEIARLVPTVDVVVVALPSKAVRDSALSYEAVSALNPAVISPDILAVRSHRPLAGLDAEDGLVMAKAGIFRDQAGWNAEPGRPVFRASRDGSYFAAMLAVQGILAALRDGNHRSGPDGVDDNAPGAQLSAESASSLVAPRARGAARRVGCRYHAQAGRGAYPPASSRSAPSQSDRSAGAVLRRTLDCALPHRTPFLPSLDRSSRIDWIWQDERFKGAPYRFPTKRRVPNSSHG